MIPFIISEDLEEFIQWCGGDLYRMSYPEALEWAELMEEWELCLLDHLYPTACHH